ncbi:MAG: hypothetical protein EOO28_22870 [Comamonadaceae bacterium]|nr:MAG: hypothetical protein EOO28_22870 [Comamonadaceae bacterium]
MNLKICLSALMLALAVVACDSDGTTPGTATPASTMLSGTAAVGDPVAGGTVSFQCAAGTNPANTITAANGSWTVQVDGATFPCVVKVSGGSPAASLASLALGTAEQVNVTPLTDLIFASAAGSTPAAWAAAHPADFGPALAALALRLPAAAASVKANLAAAGYTVPDGNLFTASFNPVNGDPYDDLLEALKTSLADSGRSFSDLVASSAAAGTGTFAIPRTRYITAADVATTPKLNSSSLTISGDVLTMRTNVTEPNPAGAFLGGGQGNKAILEIPGLAGMKVADLKSVAMELKMVKHEIGNPGYYGNAPYVNFLVDLTCDMSPLPAGMTVAQAQLRRRHIVYNPEYQVAGAVSTTTFVTGSATSDSLVWGMSGSPLLGMQPNATGAPLGRLSFDLAAYPDACIVDGASADNGVWRDKAADPSCDTTSALGANDLAKCGRAYKGVIVNLGNSSNRFEMEWQVKSVRINDRIYKFKP